MNKEKRKKDVFRGGQSLVEYIILMAVVIAFLVIFLSPGGHFQSMYQNVILQQGGDMFNVAVGIFN